MNESLLIDMMSEVDLDFIQNDYMEKDMKRKIGSILEEIEDFFYRTKHFFLFQKKQEILLDESLEKICDEISESSSINDRTLEYNRYMEGESKYSFSIRAFEKKFWNAKRVLSGVVAAVMVCVGIVIIIKHDIKLLWNHII